MPVADKVVLVTGGASGIGRASAILLSGNGAKVIVADHNQEGASAVRDEIAAAGGIGQSVVLDVVDRDAVGQMVDDAVSDYRRIDVLVHCAGICPRRPVLEMSHAEWRRVIDVNLNGTFHVAQAVGKVMAAQHSGTIILLTSDRGVYGSADYAHYAASKGGTIALTKSLALSLGHYGVTVNGINPGMTDTPLAREAIPAWDEKKGLDVLGACSLPEDIAEIVLFLVGTAGRFMTGQIVSTRMRTTA